MKYQIQHILSLLIVTQLLTACSDAVDTLLGGGGIGQGEAVVFTTLVPDVKHSTRSAKTDWLDEVRAYKAVQQDYTFNIEMYQQGNSVAVGNSNYKPMSTDGGYTSDGTLQNISSPLYWQDNVSKWGFRATAGTEILESEQSTQSAWLAQDRLIGYSYLPIWTGDDATGSPTDNFNSINYRTSKQWYADNKTAKDLSGLMVESNEDYKKIPLFFQHQRAWVTVILKAGEGVNREALAFATSADKIHTTIYSYKDGAALPQAITPWSCEELINYDADKNGEAETGVSTTRYDAIVEPHNFIASKVSQEQDIIARINVSDQKFTFAAANDINYGSFLAGDDAEATRKMQVYNLQPGKHLTITATLTRASRLILITAWIEDWTETVTQTVCDDYGQNGNPYQINNEAELIDFLKDSEKNKAGNVGIIVPNIFPALTDAYTGNYTLNATLNLANCQMQISKQFLTSISRTGSIINGEFSIADEFNDRTTIASTNYGSLERVRITTSGELSPARASVAGVVETNYGSIYQCTSELTVEGSTGYIGGIAALSLYNTDDDPQPVIDGCTVTARVGGADDETSVTAGGGIVGKAAGRVSNNTFEYGITLLQDVKYQNIIGAIATTKGLENHANNSWPTTASYTVSGSSTVIVNSNTGQRYNEVIDCQEELMAVLGSSYNKLGANYRIANSFTVTSDTWIWGREELKDEYFDVQAASGEYQHGLVRFRLNGNGKTIALTGQSYATMLFGSIIGEVYDLDIELDKPIVADRIYAQNASRDDSNTDAIAAFAYAVTTAGDVKGVIRNVNLKSNHDSYIQASTPGGLVVWAMHGGKIVNCTSDIPVRMHLTTDGVDARHYAGGIVACAQKATIQQCKYYSQNGVGWQTTYDVPNMAKAQKSNCRYGGIVGGTTEIPNSADSPCLEISDCYSWWELPTFDSDVLPANRPVMGSIIGSTVYHDPNVATRLYNAMADNNAGNWWVGLTGAGLLKSDVTEEQAIGKKNGVVPTK